VISRNIGIANLVLPEESISDDVTTATPTVPEVEKLKLNEGFKKYRDLITSLTD
jgi:hypothetical protein